MSHAMSEVCHARQQPFPRAIGIVWGALILCLSCASCAAPREPAAPPVEEPATPPVEEPAAAPPEEPAKPPADEPVWVDSARGLMWTVKASAEMSWGEAQAYVKELRYAGYEDWRLPTMADLESLIDQEILERVGDDSDVTPLLDQFRTPGEGYLFSGTLVSSDRPDEPYVMNLRNGHIFNGHEYRGFVRAVRDAGPDDSR